MYEEALYKCPVTIIIINNPNPTATLQMDGPTDEPTDGPTDRRTDQPTDRPTDGPPTDRVDTEDRKSTRLNSSH